MLLASVLISTLSISPMAWAGPPEQLVPPKPTNQVTYAYPEALLELDEPPAGKVTIRYVVRTDGTPSEIELLEGVHPDIDAVALAAVEQLRFEPATYEGEVVEVILSITLEFTPPSRPEPEPDETRPDEIGTAEIEIETELEPEPAASGPVRITGMLLEAGEGTPVPGVTVLAVPADPDYPLGRVRQQLYGDEREPAWMLRTVSDGEGRFSLHEDPQAPSAGRVRLIMLGTNFERLEWVVELSAGETLDKQKFFLTRVAGTPYRTEVSTERETMPEAVIRTIEVEQINEIPGTQGDGLKALQNFPGVARAPFGAGQLVIRGSAPADSGVYLGYHEIPTLFHFGGLTSVFNSDILAQIDFVPGNFDSRYGDATGGIVNVQPRKGRRDGYHGYVDADLFDAGALVEGPVGKGSFVLSARRSYVDAILPVVIPDEVGLGLTLAPRYWDYQALFDYPVDGGELSIRSFGSDDRTKLIFAEQNEVSEDERDRLETTQWFHRVDVVYRKVTGPWEFLITPSYKRELFSSSFFGGVRFTVESDTFSGRAELSRRLTSNVRLRVGSEVVAQWFRGRASLPPIGPQGPEGGAAATQVRETPYTRVVPGLYSTLTVRAGEKFMLFPGVRLNYYGAPRTASVSPTGTEGRFAIDPRVRFIWSMTESTAFKGGVGLYSQGPGLLQTDMVFGNPRVRLERSLHTSLGIEQKLPWDVTLEVTGFYKELWDLISPSTNLLALPSDDGQLAPQPENFANTGTGRVFGGELLLQKPLGDRFYGWLSYTLMRSVRTPAPGQPQQLFDFDQTHILTLIASYDFPYNWRIGARFRLVSGSPYTPITDAAFDATDGSYIPINGPANSARLPMFHQLDLRIDKTWVYRRVRVTSYLDVQNVYNAENVEFLSYSYDYRRYRPILSLPTAPSIGTKIEF